MFKNYFQCLWKIYDTNPLESILAQVSSPQISLHSAISLYSKLALAASLLVGAVARYSRGYFRVCCSQSMMT